MLLSQLFELFHGACAVRGGSSFKALVSFRSLSISRSDPQIASFIRISLISFVYLSYIIVKKPAALFCFASILI